MTASLIDGIAIAAKVRSEVAVGVRRLLKDSGKLFRQRGIV